MKKAFLFLALFGLSLAAPRTASADISVDFFYNNLSGGSWIDTGDYGYCWQPDVAATNPEWRPYADGYWAYTDLGWTWVSYEDFGWATYHYGRWARLSDYGWVWTPGRDADLEWGPAWVSWRTGGEYIGWAPLPPATIGLVESSPIHGHLDVEFDIGPGCYNFIDARYIGEPVLRERIVPVAQNVTFVQKTVNVTNITYTNKVVYNYGPDINVVNRTSVRPIQRLRLDRQQNVDVSAAAKSGGLTKVQGNTLVVAAPMHIAKSAAQGAPPAVKTKVEKAKIDHGWSAVGDEKAQTEFKQKLKNEDSRKVSPVAETGAAVNTPPTSQNGRDMMRNRHAEQQATGQPTITNVPNSGTPGANDAATGSSNVNAADENGRGHRRERLEQKTNAMSATPPAQVNPAQSQAESATAGEGQGRRGGRNVEGQTSGPVVGSGQENGGGQKHQGQGQERHDEKRGKASPAPTP